MLPVLLRQVIVELAVEEVDVGGVIIHLDTDEATFLRHLSKILYLPARTKSDWKSTGEFTLIRLV